MATDKNIMMETAQVTCGLPKGPCSHKQAWWWNEEVAEEVRERRKRMEIEKNSTEACRSTRKIVKMRRG